MNLESSYIRSSSGTKVRILEWKADRKPEGLVIFTHGYAGHAARYQNFAEAMLDESMVCMAVDLTGHGMSEGKRAYIDSFDQYIDDYRSLYSLAVNKYKGVPVFLFGHSMGALITAIFALKSQPKVAGVLLSGIALFVTDSVSPILVKLSSVLSKIAPALPATKLKSSLTSTVDQSVTRYDTDPLIYHGGIRARTGHEFMMATEWAKTQLAQFHYPIFLLHGELDGLANKKGSEYFYAQAGSEDKTLRILKGLYHEILNEKQAPEVLLEMRAWIRARL